MAARLENGINWGTSLSATDVPWLATTGNYMANGRHGVRSSWSRKILGLRWRRGLEHQRAAEIPVVDADRLEFGMLYQQLVSGRDQLPHPPGGKSNTLNW